MEVQEMSELLQPAVTSWPVVALRLLRSWWFPGAVLTLPMQWVLQKCLAGQGCLQGPPCLQADTAQSRLHFVVGVKRSAEICCQAHEEGDLIMGRSHC